MTDAIPLFVWCSIFALVLSLIFMILICACTTLVTWLMVITLGVVLILFGAFVIFAVHNPGPLNDGTNAARVKYLSYIMNHKVGLTIAAVVFILLGLFVFFLIFKFSKYIKSSIPILDLASKATLKNILLIFLSIFTIMAQIAIFFGELYIILRIYTSGEEQHDESSGSPFVTYQNGEFAKFSMLIHGFGLYWLIIVLNNFNDYVCAAITVNYYFKTDISNARIFCHTLGHNVGTVAWSVILLPILLVKLVFGWMDYLLTSENPNGLQRFFNKILCPCCWCYEVLIDRFSENSFPISYMGSEGFFKSNTRYYYLSEKYSEETYMISLIG